MDKIRLFLLSTLLFFSVTTNADSIVWTFDNFVFSDGADVSYNLSGTFTYEVGGGLTALDVNIPAVLIEGIFWHDSVSLSPTQSNVSSWGATGEVIPWLDPIAFCSPGNPSQCEYELFFESLVYPFNSVQSLEEANEVYGGSSAVTTLYHNTSFLVFEGLLLPLSIGASDLATMQGVLISPVPLPPAVWLFGSSLGLLGWMRRKQLLT